MGSFTPSGGVTRINDPLASQIERALDRAGRRSASPTSFDVDSYSDDARQKIQDQIAKVTSAKESYNSFSGDKRTSAGVALRKAMEAEQKELEKMLNTFSKLPGATEKAWKAFVPPEGVQKGFNKAQKLKNDVYNGRFGNTAVGKFVVGAANTMEKMNSISSAGAYVGNAIGKIGGGGGGVISKAFGKLGGVVTKVTGLFSKLAGPVGWAIQIFKMFADAYGEHLKFQAKLRDVNTNFMVGMMSAVKQSYEIGTEQTTAYIQMGASIAQAQRQLGATLLQQAKGLNVNIYADAVETMLDSMFKGINESAYAAASRAIQFGAEVEKTQRAKTYGEKTVAQTERALRTEYDQRSRLWEEQMTKGAALGMASQWIENWNSIADLYKEGSIPAIVADQMFGSNANNAKTVFGQLQNELTYTKTDENGRTITVAPLDEVMGNVLKYKNREGAFGNDAARAGMTMNIAGMFSDALADGLNEREKSLMNKGLKYAESTYEANLSQLSREVAVNTATVRAQADLQKITIEAQKAAADQVTQAAEKIAQAQLKLAQQIEGLLGKMDELTNDLSISMGIMDPDTMLSFQKSQMGLYKEIGGKWGIKNPEEFFKMQQTYVESTGRNRTLSADELENIVRMGKVMGGMENATKMASELQIFNKSASDTANMMGNIMSKANRMGLNMRKVSKEMLDNIKLANKYNFKNGTRGLMEMTLWAQKTRFNMSSIGAMLDKVQEGGLEGVITQAAGFQVLGGHAAMNSDPLGMLFDAWADPQAYAKRMQDMTTGFGRFNRKTGETEFNINESMQMAQIAKLQGRSVEEVRNEVMERNKRKSIESFMTPDQLANLNDEMKTAIANNATFDKESGRWKIKMKNGQTVDISDINEKNIDQIQPQEYQENVLWKLDDIRTVLSQATGIEVSQRTDQAINHFEEYRNNVFERMRISDESYQANRDKYDTDISEGMSLATSAYGDFAKMFEEGNGQVDADVKAIMETAGNLKTGVATLNGIINDANSKLGASFATTDAKFESLNNAIAKAMQKLLNIMNEEGDDTMDAAVAAWFRAPGIGAGHQYAQNQDIQDNRIEIWRKLKKANTLSELQDAFTDNHGRNELETVFREYGLINDDNWNSVAHLKALRDQIMKYTYHTGQGKKGRNGNITPTVYINKASDAFIDPVGPPPLIRATNVTPINDGFVQPDSDDTFLAAKKGGPVFGKLHNIAKSVSTMGDILYPLASDIRRYGLANSPYGNTNNGNVNINMGGTLRIEGENGHVVELLLNEMENNPKRRRDFANSVFRAMDEGLNQGRMYFAGTPRNVASYNA